MENYIFNKICTDKGPFRIHVTISEGSFQLIVLQKEVALKTEVTKEELKHFAEQHKSTLDSYYERLLQYLKTGNSDVVFSLTDTEFTITRVLKDSLKVKFFSCTLQKVNYIGEVEQIIDTLYSKYSSALKQLEKVTKECDEINQNKLCCETKLKELVNQKISDENKQFGQFVLILNEKKRMIQHLEETLEAFKKGRPTLNPAVVPKSKKRKTATGKTLHAKKETISESDSSVDSEDGESEYNSPDEKSGSSNESQDEKQSVEKNNPSTSTDLISLFENDNSSSHSLPKRIKTSNNDVIIKPALSAPPKSEIEAMEKNERSKTPEIDLNTQELLDML